MILKTLPILERCSCGEIPVQRLENVYLRDGDYKTYCYIKCPSCGLQSESKEDQYLAFWEWNNQFIGFTIGDTEKAFNELSKAFRVFGNEFAKAVLELPKRIKKIMENNDV